MPAVRAAWKRPGVRSAVWQALASILVAVAALFVFGNVSGNLARRSLGIDFGFLAGRASFEFGENLAGYRPGDSFVQAFLAGLGNTALVAVLGIALTTVVALALCLMRLSGNRLARRIAWLWIEGVRNTPLLLQLLFWHQVVIRQLPLPRQAWEPLPGVFLSNRGLLLPALVDQPGFRPALLALAAALALVQLLRRRVPRPVLAALVLGAPVLAFALTGTPLTVTWPELRGFNFQGGVTLSPEFVALVSALVTYQSGFAAETIRSGIMAVPRGQTEAASALGLGRYASLRCVILPQALRIIIPPMTSQYLSLTKNSSLAVAIGFPDLVRVSQVTISETGRAVECITILLLVYLSLSLLTATIMNRYNRSIMRQAGR